MFALTKKTDYAIIALAHMAQRPGVICNAREIAERFHVPLALMIKVLKVLSQGELVRSIRGVKGGYTLAMPAERISLAAIIATIEGPVRFVQCAGSPEPHESACELLEVCPVTRTVRKVHEKLKGFLNQVTLADIAYDRDYGNGRVPVSVEGQEVRRETVL